MHENGSVSVSPVKKHGHKHGVKDLRFSPDGAVLALACKDGVVYLLDVDNVSRPFVL
jgi:WD40 repeat protein